MLFVDGGVVNTDPALGKSGDGMRRKRGVGGHVGGESARAGAPRDVGGFSGVIEDRFGKATTVEVAGAEEEDVFHREGGFKLRFARSAMISAGARRAWRRAVICFI